MPPLEDEKKGWRIGRREFHVGAAGAGVGLGLGAISHWLPLRSPDVGPDWSRGEESFVPSSCLLCPAHCGIRGRVVDGHLVKIEGNPLHPVSRGGLCPKGIAGIQLLYHPARLTGPVERVGPPGSDQFRRVSWDEAMSRIASALGKLRATGESSSACWVGGHVQGVMGELLDRFSRACGSGGAVFDGYDDGAARVLALTQGIDASPAFDLEGADLVLSFGAPLSEAWWCPPQSAGARSFASGRRPRWIQVDVRHSRTASAADDWVPVRPDSYGVLALGIAYVLLKEGLYDVDAVHKQTTGIEDWIDESGRTVSGFRSLVLRHGRTEEVSKRTGVPPDTVVALAKRFGRARRAVVVWDQAVSWRRGGLTDALAIHTLNILSGALERPGGVTVQPPMPVPSLGGTQETPPGGDSAAPRFADWSARLLRGGEPPVKALFLYYSNPIASAPNGRALADALSRVGLIVSFSPFLDETARHAHLVLPDHTYLERWQDAPAPATVPIRVWGIVQPIVPPLHETRATGDVILGLASRLGPEVASRFPWSSVEQIVRERSGALSRVGRGGVFVGGYRRDELRELEARGWWLPHGMAEDRFWSAVKEKGGWFDPYYDHETPTLASRFPDGRARIFSAEARKAAAGGQEGDAFLPTEAEARKDEGFPLRLVPYRVMTLASGTTAWMPWLLETLGVMTGDAWQSWVEINPATATELGLAEGQKVRVESSDGSFTARLRAYAGCQPGVVNVPYGLHSRLDGWGDLEPSNPLAAVGDKRDPVTGLPDWYTTFVRVVAA